MNSIGKNMRNNTACYYNMCQSNQSSNYNNQNNNNNNQNITNNFNKINSNIEKLENKNDTCSCNIKPNKDGIFYLRNEHFTNGTFIIKEEGTYILQENIIFKPNINNDYMPRESQLSFQPFVMGFFAAIAIATSNVVIDLNGKTLKQSKEHNLQQRFYSNICTFTSPFISGNGPSNFINDDDMFGINNVTIKNGFLGLSSHHGILGNENNNITIENVTIKDFEVAGISFNGSKNITIKNCIIGPSFNNVPLNTSYSASRFIRGFVKKIYEKNPLSYLEINNEKLTGDLILSRLEERMNLAFNDVITKGGRN